MPTCFAYCVASYVDKKKISRDMLSKKINRYILINWAYVFKDIKEYLSRQFLVFWISVNEYIFYKYNTWKQCKVSLFYYGLCYRFGFRT